VGPHLAGKTHFGAPLVEAAAFFWVLFTAEDVGGTKEVVYLKAQRSGHLPVFTQFQGQGVRDHIRFIAPEGQIELASVEEPGPFGRSDAQLGHIHFQGRLTVVFIKAADLEGYPGVGLKGHHQFEGRDDPLVLAGTSIGFDIHPASLDLAVQLQIGEALRAGGITGRKTQGAIFFAGGFGLLRCSGSLLGGMNMLGVLAKTRLGLWDRRGGGLGAVLGTGRGVGRVAEQRAMVFEVTA